jgi:ssDNA-specific exonuclease RecJ
MEPYGVGHRRPLFSISAGECRARVLKAGSPHLAVKSEFIDLTYFSGMKNLKILESDVRKNIVFEISTSRFKGREYVKGLVRELIYDGRTGRYTAESIFANGLARALAETVEVEKECLSTAQIQALIAQKTANCRYGLCLIASDRRTVQAYEELTDWACDLFYPASKNLANTLLISPAPDADLSGYRDIVFLDTPADMNILSLKGRKVFVNQDKCGYTMFDRISVSRERLLDIFSALRRSVATLFASTAEELACACDGLGFDRLEFIFAVNVFEELGLVEFNDGKLTVYRGVKADLTDSAIYKKVCLLQER